jgi:hypothetical protein
MLGSKFVIYSLIIAKDQLMVNHPILAGMHSNPAQNQSKKGIARHDDLS